MEVQTKTLRQCIPYIPSSIIGGRDQDTQTMYTIYTVKYYWWTRSRHSDNVYHIYRQVLLVDEIKTLRQCIPYIPSSIISGRDQDTQTMYTIYTVKYYWWTRSRHSDNVYHIYRQVLLVDEITSTQIHTTQTHKHNKTKGTDERQKTED